MANAVFMVNDGDCGRRSSGEGFIGVDVHLKISVRLLHFLLGFFQNSGIEPDELFKSALLYALDTLFAEVEPNTLPPHPLN